MAVPRAGSQTWCLCKSLPGGAGFEALRSWKEADAYLAQWEAIGVCVVSVDVEALGLNGSWREVKALARHVVGSVLKRAYERYWWRCSQVADTSSILEKPVPWVNRPSGTAVGRKWSLPETRRQALWSLEDHDSPKSDLNFIYTSGLWFALIWLSLRPVFFLLE